jgi:hypothetical protein
MNKDLLDWVEAAWRQFSHGQSTTRIQGKLRDRVIFSRPAKLELR